MVWAIEHSWRPEQAKVWPATTARSRVAKSIRRLRRPGARSYAISSKIRPGPAALRADVAIDPAQGDIALERGVVIRARSDGTIFTLPPRGRVLNPTGAVPYRVGGHSGLAGASIDAFTARARTLPAAVHVARSQAAVRGRAD